MYPRQSEGSLRFHKLLSENIRRDLSRKQQLKGRVGEGVPKFTFTVRECTQDRNLGLRKTLQIGDTAREKSLSRIFKTKNMAVAKPSVAGSFFGRAQTIVRQPSEGRVSAAHISHPDKRRPFGCLKNEPYTLRQDFNDYYYEHSGRAQDRLLQPRNSMYFQEVDGNFEGDDRLTQTKRLDALLAQKMSYVSFSSDSESNEGAKESDLDKKGPQRKEGKRESRRSGDPSDKLVSFTGPNGDLGSSQSFGNKSSLAQHKKSAMFDPCKSGLRLGESLNCHRSPWALQVEALLECPHLGQAQPGYYSHKRIERTPESEEVILVIRRTLQAVMSDMRRFAGSD